MKKLSRRTDDSAFVGEYDIEKHKLMTMAEEKRERLIHEALKEFLKGYEAANTDVIVKEAGISKGLIFHYFGSKRGLFLFLLKYALNVVSAEYANVVSDNRDFLENISAVTMRSGEIVRQHPLIYAFLAKSPSSITSVFPEGLPADVPTHMVAQYVWERSDHDKSLFKKGIDPKKARNIILWTMNGLSESFLRYGDDIEVYEANHEEIVKEQEAYLRILRELFYR